MPAAKRLMTIRTLREQRDCFSENDEPEPQGSCSVDAVLVPRPARGAGQVLFYTPLRRGSESTLGSASFLFALSEISELCFRELIGG